MGNYLVVTGKYLFEHRLDSSDIQVLGTVERLDVAVNTIQESNQLIAMRHLSRNQTRSEFSQLVGGEESVDLFDNSSNRASVTLSGSAR